MTQDVLKNLLPKFIEDLKLKGRSPSTITAYSSDLTQLIDFTNHRGHITSDQIQAEDLESFRDTLISQKYTAKSVSRKLNATKTFFRWLLENQYLLTDPSRSVAHPKIESAPPKFLSQIEYRALRDVTREDIRIATIVEIILQTGLRISEVANLKLANVTTDKVKIEAYANQAERNIPFNKAARTALDNYLTKRPKVDSPFIFVSKNGKPLAVRNIRASVDRYINKAELPKYSVNDLRTTFIVENIKSGADIVLLSQIAGHKRLSTTERYLELAGTREPGKRQSLIEL